jgi:hypothetical protein
MTGAESEYPSRARAAILKQGAPSAQCLVQHLAQLPRLSRIDAPDEAAQRRGPVGLVSSASPIRPTV